MFGKNDSTKLLIGRAMPLRVALIPRLLRV